MWVENRWLDVICPMAYTPDAATFASQIASVRQVAGTQPVWAGIGAYRLSPAQTMDNINTARRLGASGIVLFSYDSLVHPPRGLEYLDNGEPSRVHAVSVNRTPDFSPPWRGSSPTRGPHTHFPAAAVEVGTTAGPIWRHAAGHLTYDEDARCGHRRHALRPRLADQGAGDDAARDAAGGVATLFLNAPVSAYVRDWSGPDRASVVISDLLEHAAGLTSWWDLYRRRAGRDRTSRTRSPPCRSSTRRARDRSTATSGSSCSG